MSEPKTIVLLDLSGVSFPIWIENSSSSNPEAAATRIVAKIRELVGKYPHVAICCDKPPYFRKDIDPSYKANRKDRDDSALFQHQLTLARETLVQDGFPVWEVPGYEGDDIIASGAMRAVEMGASVLVVSPDKDLLQLIGPTVQAVSLNKKTLGAVVDEEFVLGKLGVKPSQVRDYLSLCGDSSDGIVGAKGIGPVTAVNLLTEYGSLDKVYEVLVSDEGAKKFTPAVRQSLTDFYPRMATVRQLIELRTDAPVQFDDVLKERQPLDMGDFENELALMDEAIARGIQMPTEEVEPIAPNETPLPMVREEAGQTALVVKDAELMPAIPFNMQLEPRSLGDAFKLADAAFRSRLYSAYGSPSAVMTTILAGREFGLQAMASLRAFHVVEGRPTLAADTMRALVLKSGKAEYFICTERTDDLATFETKRAGSDKPVSLSYSMADALKAGLVKPKGGYDRSPADMLVARASSKLARLVYPDVLFGLLAPEEID